jgi:hypothetical protein
MALCRMINHTIKIHHLYTSVAHNYFGSPHQMSQQNPTIDNNFIEIVSNKGIIGDRFFNRKSAFDGQVTFIN